MNIRLVVLLSVMLLSIATEKNYAMSLEDIMGISGPENVGAGTMIVYEGRSGNANLQLVSDTVIVLGKAVVGLGKATADLHKKSFKERVKTRAKLLGLGARLLVVEYRQETDEKRLGDLEKEMDSSRLELEVLGFRLSNLNVQTKVDLNELEERVFKLDAYTRLSLHGLSRQVAQLNAKVDGLDAKVEDLQYVLQESKSKKRAKVSGNKAAHNRVVDANKQAPDTVQVLLSQCMAQMDRNMEKLEARLCRRLDVQEQRLDVHAKQFRLLWKHVAALGKRIEDFEEQEV